MTETTSFLKVSERKNVFGDVSGSVSALRNIKCCVNQGLNPILTKGDRIIHNIIGMLAGYQFSKWHNMF
jgi:hypothetical protein